jgi:hypothetical protein
MKMFDLIISWFLDHQTLGVSTIMISYFIVLWELGLLETN